MKRKIDPDKGIKKVEWIKKCKAVLERDYDYLQILAKVSKYDLIAWIIDLEDEHERYKRLAEGTAKWLNKEQKQHWALREKYYNTIEARLERLGNKIKWEYSEFKRKYYWPFKKRVDMLRNYFKNRKTKRSAETLAFLDNYRRGKKIDQCNLDGWELYRSFEGQHSEREVTKSGKLVWKKQKPVRELGYKYNLPGNSIIRITFVDGVLDEVRHYN